MADINADALTVIGPSHDIAVIGYGQSQLDNYLVEAARTQGRALTPDKVPKGFFARSEQFNFAKAGVPVLYARSGLDLLDGGVTAGRKAYDDYIANRYHQPGDAFDPNWDLSGRWCRTCGCSAWSAASSPREPRRSRNGSPAATSGGLGTEAK